MPIKCQACGSTEVRFCLSDMDAEVDDLHYCSECADQLHTGAQCRDFLEPDED